MEGNRVMVREWADTDVQQLHEIYKDPEIFRYIPGGIASADIGHAKKRLRGFISSRNVGFEGAGIFALVNKEISRPVGSVLLKPLRLNGGAMAEEIEIGWHLKREYRGQGMATEAARLILEYAFKNLKLNKVYAVVKPENTASRRVAERLGMHEEGLCQKYYDETVVLFSLSSGEYRHLRQP